MRYVVRAPLVIVHDRDGAAHHKYEGQRIQYLSDVQREHLLELGMVEEISEPVPPGVVPQDAEPDEAEAAEVAPDAAKPDRPNQVAPKEVWVDYAVRGLGIDQADAEAMTKADLIALPAQ